MELAADTSGAQHTFLSEEAENNWPLHDSQNFQSFIKVYKIWKELARGFNLFQT